MFEAHLYPGLFAPWSSDDLAEFTAYEHNRRRMVRHFGDAGLPHCISSMKERFEAMAGFTPHVCMMNVYAEDSGVTWHFDSDVKQLAIVSLGGEADFGYADEEDGDFEYTGREPSRPTWLSLGHGDLLVFPDARHALHSVRNLEPRRSLVFRDYLPRRGRPCEPIW